MKVCTLCGEEISTRDGDNECPACEFAAQEEKVNKERRAERNRQRRERDQVMRDCGLVKVRGAMGGTYYE